MKRVQQSLKSSPSTTSQYTADMNSEHLSKYRGGTDSLNDTRMSFGD